jgi:hypothetical protein
VYLDALGDLEDDPAADPEWGRQNHQTGFRERSARSRCIGAITRPSSRCRSLPFSSSPKWPDGYKAKNEEEGVLIERERVLGGRWAGKLKQDLPDARFVVFRVAGPYYG